MFTNAIPQPKHGSFSLSFSLKKTFSILMASLEKAHRVNYVALRSSYDVEAVSKATFES